MATAVTAYTITCRFECSRCNHAEDGPTVFMPLHGEMPWFPLPAGWHSLDGKAICRKHLVWLADKDETVPIGAVQHKP